MDQSLSGLEQKIKEAKERIKSTLTMFGANHVYAAYSGGKDSEAVLRLSREVCPNILVIHNGHKGEHVDKTEGVLFVKEPKAENVPLFLKTVNLKAQIDGTRRDEDKTVIFEGKEIHRSKMSRPYTDLGVWGLHVCFPLFDWTENDVYAYLSQFEPLLFTYIKQSYEGEGDLIGTKTLFCRYPCSPIIGVTVNSDDLKNKLGNVSALYVTVNKFTDKLSRWIASLEFPVTLDMPSSEWRGGLYQPNPNVRYFIRVNELSKPSRFPAIGNVFIKVLASSWTTFSAALELANRFADEGHQVLLMPDFGTFRTADLLGKEMIESFDKVHKGVRVMPPMQNLLGIS